MSIRNLYANVCKKPKPKPNVNQFIAFMDALTFFLNIVKTLQTCYFGNFEHA